MGVLATVVGAPGMLAFAAVPDGVIPLGAVGGRPYSFLSVSNSFACAASHALVDFHT